MLGPGGLGARAYRRNKRGSAAGTLLVVLLVVALVFAWSLGAFATVGLPFP